LKRLLALLVLAVLAVVAYSYWKGRPVSLPSGSSETLGQVGDKLGQVGDKVGEKLQGAKASGSVKAALELNRTLKAYPIDVDSAEGTVILRGEVPSEELRVQAEKVAASVPDVTQVRNELRVNPGLAPAAGGGERTLGENFDDKALETKVRLAFSLNKDLKGTSIDVKSYRREVALSGTVPSEAHRQLALQIARETTDVLAVRDGLAVGAAAAPPAGAAPGQPGSAAAAAGAAQRAQAALRGHASLAAYVLDIREEGGQLVLSGTVRTPAERDLAGLVAKEAAGVAVQNKVAVRP
jgi:hyperosmotically inducible periplasmic protein